METQKADQQFLNIIKENEGIVYKIASFYASVEYSVGDLYQEIILNLWKAFPSFRGESKYSTWIYRIALNTCISYLRKKIIKTDYIDIHFEIPEEQGTNEQLQELYILINKLGDMEKALVLLYLEDKSYKEIALITGITVTNVATRLNRIKLKLKEMSKELDN